MIKKIVVLFLKFYKKLISPLYPASCRYYPTCSHYAIESVEKYGVLKGLLKAIWRVLRCNPFSKGGIDHP